MNSLTKFEHAALLIDCGGHRLAIDPSSMTGPESRRKLRDVHATLVTHTHPDHFDAIVLGEIGAPVFGPSEVVAKAATAGLTATVLTLGRTVNIGGTRVTAVAANHGPAVTTPVQNFGFIVAAANHRLFITGDMAGPQEMVPSGPFELVVLPVEGGGFVFDGKEAAQFLRRLDHSGIAIPVHADDAPDMTKQFSELAGSFCKPVVLGVGDSVEF